MFPPLSRRFSAMLLPSCPQHLPIVDLLRQVAATFEQ